ncbi:Rieske (2Fe-2S) protein [Phenylobacterium sp. Root700]|uniref:Rieske (2Fe-2S) protein n=1 Tax=Phenylobacterium sp. Root700 TaxID=1736591 RepID=UPI0009EAE65E|nr:Rieske (2Fe-2S) protein [Phenylobacterium sp. Root700]
MSASWIGSGLPAIRRGGQDYFLLSHEDELYLVANSCPHRGGPLKFGFVNASGQIVCPLHGGAFAISQLIARPSTIRLREGPAGSVE